MQGTRYLAASLLLLLLATGLDAQSSNCWAWYSGTLIYGGTLISNITSLTACQTFCTLSPGCASIDWAYNNAQGSQCFLLMTQNGKVSNVNGVDHYDYTCQGGGTGCQFNPFPNTNIYGGTLMNNYNTLATCQAACIAQQSTCQSIDWVQATSQCFFLGTQNGKNSNIQGVNHYDLVCNGATQLPGASTTTLPGTGGPGSCSFSPPFQNTNIYGGAVNPATTLSGCQNACIMNTSCQGIDWAPGNANGQQCFLLSTTNGKNPNTNGVTHFDYLCNGTGGSTTVPGGILGSSTTLGSCYWTPYPNMQILGGMQTPGDTLPLCQQVCVNTPGCAGVDFTPNNPSGSKCYLLMTANGRVPSQSGTTHYDYTCPNNPNTNCWQTFLNTNIYGGTVNPAPSLTACYSACIAVGKPACMSIDWAPANPAGSQCFLLNTQTGKNPGTTGVNHYDYIC